MITPNEYQKEAHTFADYNKGGVTDGDILVTTDYLYPALGLAEEAGEVAGKYAKAIRDCVGEIDEERREAIVKELGDVMWFVSELASLLCVPLEEVMVKNLTKLRSRKERNVIHGSGDNR